MASTGAYNPRRTVVASHLMSHQEVMSSDASSPRGPGPAPAMKVPPSSHLSIGPAVPPHNEAGAASNLADQMLLHFLQARQLQVAAGGQVHKEDGKRIATGPHDAEVPVRTINRSTRWVAAVLLLVLLGISAQSYWFMAHLLLRNKATWQWMALAFIPAGMLFFAMALKMGLQAIMGPFVGSIHALKINSEFYSALPTPVAKGQKLPEIVVQIPVYKEDLNDVIIPTLRSVGVAMDHYRAHGGNVKLLICDDGLQLLEDSLFLERMTFYRKNLISFVARPPRNRRGLFKKASNLNYAMHLADQVVHLQQTQGTSHKHALAEVWERMEHKFMAGGDIVIPDDALILLLDADTKVPEECMSQTVGEFLADPHLPYTQHFTCPFEEQSRNYWEQLISAFTRKIYTAGIAVGASQGDYAPLVGHNAFLRFSAMKSVAFFCEEEKRLKYWSETTVSEDFDLFIRLATKDMFGRYVMYTGDGFQEGVSLSYIDEVIKLRKFTYGACEMCFNPLIKWWRGPLSPILIGFLGSKLPWYWKVGLLTYLGSYFAMAATLPYVLLEAALSVYSNGYLSNYGVRGFDVMLTCVVMFGGLATLHEVVIEWRMKALQGVSMLMVLWNNFKWLPCIALLYGGVAFSMTTAAFCYFFSVKIVWGATVKETTDMSCWVALKTTWAMFGVQYVVLSAFLGAYVTAVVWYDLGLYFCWGPIWYCGLHLATPILLNPHVMSLAF